GRRPLAGYTRSSLSHIVRKRDVCRSQWSENGEVPSLEGGAVIDEKNLDRIQNLEQIAVAPVRGNVFPEIVLNGEVAVAAATIIVMAGEVNSATGVPDDV